MTNTKSFVQLAKLEKYLLALENARSEPTLRESLNRIGISDEVLEEGSNLHSIANEAYLEASAARKKRMEAFAVFSKKKEALDEHFNVDIKKARIAFLNDPLAQGKLDLIRRMPQDRLKQFDRSKSFYSALSDKPDLLEPLLKLGFTREHVDARLEQVSEIEKTRRIFMFEKAISQNATLIKDNAMGNLSRWMTHFFAISKNAFKEEPQLMEAFGMVVKS